MLREPAGRPPSTVGIMAEPGLRPVSLCIGIMRRTNEVFAADGFC